MSGHLPSIMIQQSEVNSLFPSDGSYGLPTPVLPTYMTVSPDVAEGQVHQVLSGAPGVVSLLPPNQALLAHSGEYKPSTPSAGRASSLSSVYDEAFLHTSLPSVVAGDNIITISFQQTAPEPDITSLYPASLDNYPTIPVADPPPPSKVAIAKGEKAKGEKQLYSCEQCQATFRRSSNLRVHVQRHLGNRPFACHQCSATFVEEKNLKRHMVAHRTDRPHVCLECGLAFVESGNLTRHMSTHSGSKEFMCDTCGAAFSKAHHLKDHLSCHVGSKSGGREHVCEECQNVFNNPFQLRKHIKSAHSGGSGRPYRCPQCGAVFGWWNIFHRHLLTHKGQKPFVCEKCNAAFLDNLALRQHKRTHARNKSNLCSLCTAAFDRPSHLVRHMRVHSGEKPNVCGECGAAFLERNKLARHMRIHDGGVGGVVCELCGARFTQTRHLTHHMKSHQDSPVRHKDKPTQPEGTTALQGKKNTPNSKETSFSPAKRKRRLEKEAVVRYISVSVHAKNKSGSNCAEEEGVLRNCEEGVTNDRSLRNQPRIPRKRQRRRKSAQQSSPSIHSHTQPQKAEQSMAGCETPPSKSLKDTRRRSRKPSTNKGLKRRKSTSTKTRLTVPSSNDDDETDEYDAHFRENCAQDGEETTKSLSEVCSHFGTKQGITAVSLDADEEDTPEVECNDQLTDKSQKEKEQETGATQEEENARALKDGRGEGGIRGTVWGDCSLPGKHGNRQTEEARKLRDCADYCVDMTCEASDSYISSGLMEGDSEMSPTLNVDVDLSPNVDGSVGAINSDSGQHQGPCATQQSSCSLPPHAALPTPHTALPTPHTALPTPHTALPTPHTALSTPHTALPTPHTALPTPLHTAQPTPESLPHSVQQQEERGSPGFVLYACQQCSAVFNTSFSLKLHKRVHQTRVSVCLRCGDVFQSSPDLAVHRKVCSGFLPEQPPVDASTAHTPGSAVHSINKSAKRKPHGCQLCPASFSLLNKLKLHLQFHTDRRKHVCSECGASFSKSTDLKAHVRTHTGDRPFVCAVCGASYTQSSTLSVHMKTHSGVKPHVCKVCNAAFPRYGRLKAHMRCHSGEKPCMCKLCGAAFKWSQTLLRHMNSEHSSSAFTCKVCEKNFQKETQLKAHLQVHSGERPHACPHCDKAFKKLVQLRRHSHVHTGNWPFLCEECGAGFGSAASLKIHMRCHTGEKPFVCEECGRAFRISSHLRRHIASHTDDPIYVRR